jgi:hypothetical protein
MRWEGDRNDQLPWGYHTISECFKEKVKKDASNKKPRIAAGVQPENTTENLSNTTEYLGDTVLTTRRDEI